ncbi:MAG: hypothetical protein RMZ43_001590 [Nostoc sp. CmiVER01]|uniref:hypothetical protein n=1 Tax=Nostoc sp. CmiVER01 TaxID=3075384 RepID=UPI002AD47A75|nr:hypothetical protein [Nostoc sp. CmiVER01]
MMLRKLTSQGIQQNIDSQVKRNLEGSNAIIFQLAKKERSHSTKVKLYLQIYLTLLNHSVIP